MYSECQRALPDSASQSHLRSCGVVSMHLTLQEAAALLFKSCSLCSKSASAAACTARSDNVIQLQLYQWAWGQSTAGLSTICVRLLLGSL